MEKAMAPHSSTLAWKIPCTEEPGRLQSMESLGVGHDWATLLSLFIFMHWRRKWQPSPVFLPGESQGREAWWAAVSGVAQSWTRLKQLSSSSSSSEFDDGIFPTVLLLKDNSVWIPPYILQAKEWMVLACHFPLKDVWITNIFWDGIVVPSIAMSRNAYCSIINMSYSTIRGRHVYCPL